jgi:predicted transcriptional regulator
MHPPATDRQAILAAGDVFWSLDQDLIKMRTRCHQPSSLAFPLRPHIDEAVKCDCDRPYLPTGRRTPSGTIRMPCSSIRATVPAMGSAPNPLSLRLGRDGLEALDEIARRRGLTRAEAARQAIAETAKRDRRRSGLAAEARALMQDKAYVDEAREVADLMERLRGSR